MNDLLQTQDFDDAGAEPVEALPVMQTLGSLVGAVGPDLAARMRSNARRLPGAYAPNSLRSLRADSIVWATYCLERGRPPLPTSVDDIEGFLRSRIALGRKKATLQHYLATLALLHELAALPNPMDTLDGKLMWKQISRGYKGQRQRHAKGLNEDAVDQLQAQLDASRPLDARDDALLSVAYETMCRQSELVSFCVEDLEFELDGTALLYLAHSKTDQDKEGAVIALSAETADKLRTWLAIAGIKTGALFRSVPRSTKPDRFDRPLSDRDVARIFKKRAGLAGLDPTRISGHSTRIGAAQDLLANGATTAEIAQSGRWKSEKQPIHYTKDLSAKRTAMARMRARRNATPPQS